MITYSQLTHLVHQNMHLFNNQIRLDEDYVLENMNESQQQNQYRRQSTTKNNKKDLKLDLWKVNQNLNQSGGNENQEYVGPILSFQRRNIWEEYDKNRYHINSSAQKPQHRKDLDRTTVRPQNYSGKKQNLSQSINHDQSLYSTVKQYQRQQLGQKKWDVQRLQKSQVNEVNINKNLKPAMRIDFNERSNGLIGASKIQPSRKSSLGRRHKIFSLPSKKQPKIQSKPQKQSLQMNQQSLNMNQTTTHHQRSNSSNFENQQHQIILEDNNQNRKMNQLKVKTLQRETTRQLPVRAVSNNKRRSIAPYLAEGDYLPSPEQLGTILKTIQRQSNQMWNHRSDKRKNHYQKKLHASIRYHDSSRVIQPIKNQQNIQPYQFSPPPPGMLGTIMQNSRSQNVDNSTRIKFNYVDSSIVRTGLNDPYL